jgi:hypothetical protein
MLHDPILIEEISPSLCSYHAEINVNKQHNRHASMTTPKHSFMIPILIFIGIAPIILPTIFLGNRIRRLAFRQDFFRLQLRHNSIK